MTADIRDRLRQLTEAQKDAALIAVLNLADEIEAHPGAAWYDADRIRAVVAAAAGDQP